MPKPSTLHAAACELSTRLERVTGTTIPPCQHGDLLVAALHRVEQILGESSSLWTSALFSSTGNVAAVTLQLSRLLPNRYFVQEDVEHSRVPWRFGDVPGTGETIRAVGLFLEERLGSQGPGIGLGTDAAVVKAKI
jgi:hypothetical protein